MYGKLILTLALVAFVAAQIAASLKCYTCDSASACKSPTTVQCDQASSNRTRDVLNSYYNGVKSYNKKDYECFSGSSYYKNKTTMAVRGCIMKGAIECSYSLKNHNFTKTACRICKTDICNKTNTAPGVSYSIFTLISLAVLAKIFAM